MNIAIIAPSPVPFTIGGAEKFWWGLHRAINQYSHHQAELIKLPAPENNFMDLMASYEMFCNLDLSHFDRVISSKYPAWMIEHPDHHCYMVHRLRGLYDTYHFTGMPLEIANPPAELSVLLALVDSGNTERSVLVPFWQEWRRLKALLDAELIAAELFAFPGPLSRKIIHFLDNIALSQSAIKRYSAISHNLVGRQDYFPENVPVHVIHPPSDVNQFKAVGETERPYIFTMSRLDQPKRIHLLIDAFKQTTADIDFCIAGTGPEEQPLRELAQVDGRIKFLGRVTDAQAIELYSAALFIPFIPYDEDYGLITIEAMKSQKAVLTTVDAGGVNEFVEHAVSGYSVEPNAKAISSAMMQLLAEPEKTRQMGKNALQKVAHVNWETVVDSLLQEGDVAESQFKTQFKTNDKRKNIVVVLTFSVWPPRGGGQSRAYNIYREIALAHDVTLVVLLDQEKIKREKGQDILVQEILIAPNMREIRVAKSPQQLDYEHELHQQLGTPVEDIACIEGYKLTPHFKTVLIDSLKTADLVIACHPYLFNAIREVWYGTLWYEAQDVEVDMKQVVLGQGDIAKHWVEKTREVEKNCCLLSEKILTCSAKDAKRLVQLYAQPEDKMLVVANGVDMRVLQGQSQKQKLEYQKITQLTSENERFAVLFMGSWHTPNIEAVEQLIRIAPECPDADFLILGSVCEHPVCEKLPDNIKSLGMVSEAEKNLFLYFADMALNPMLSGSGTNLKMLDYSANSLPVLSTPFGLRGLTFVPGIEILSAEINEFAAIINEYAAKESKPEDSEQLTNMAKLALVRTVNEYSWQEIADKLLRALKS